MAIIIFWKILNLYMMKTGKIKVYLIHKDTFKMYTDMFLTEYIILAIHLNSQGALPDMVLNKVKENANLMV